MERIHEFVTFTKKEKKRYVHFMWTREQEVLPGMQIQWGGGWQQTKFFKTFPDKIATCRQQRISERPSPPLNLQPRFPKIFTNYIPNINFSQTNRCRIWRWFRIWSPFLWFMVFVLSFVISWGHLFIIFWATPANLFRGFFLNLKKLGTKTRADGV